MSSTSKHLRKITHNALGALVLLASASTLGEEPRGAQKGNNPAAIASSASPKTEELSAQAKEALAWASDMNKEVSAIIEGWVAKGTLSPDRLFSYLYYPVENTEPTKYTTDYDTFADRDLPPILEKYFSKSSTVLYAVAMDRNGYVPTHNRQYSQPLTGNRAMDLVNNRTKRIFGDQIAFKAARNLKPYLIQSYSRDTGEVAMDISVPVMIQGRHWGCVRIGFRSVEIAR